MKNFKVVAQLLVGYFWLVMMKIKELLILIATLATTEVSVGALAKADQKLSQRPKSGGTPNSIKSVKGVVFNHRQGCLFCMKGVFLQILLVK